MAKTKQHLQPRYMGPKTLSGMLKTAGLFQRLRLGTSLTVAAAETIDHLDKRQSDLTIELAQTKRKHKEEIARIEREEKEAAKNLFRRTEAALAEMRKTKGNYKAEVPVAVVLSPYQHQQLTMGGYFKTHSLAKLEIVIAKGVYGPVVLTQDGFNGFTRNAPELNIRSAAPSRSSDW